MPMYHVSCMTLVQCIAFSSILFLTVILYYHITQHALYSTKLGLFQIVQLFNCSIVKLFNCQIGMGERLAVCSFCRGKLSLSPIDSRATRRRTNLSIFQETFPPTLKMSPKKSKSCPRERFIWGNICATSFVLLPRSFPLGILVCGNQSRGRSLSLGAACSRILKKGLPRVRLEFTAFRL